MKKSDAFLKKLVAHVNRKEWWHVPPRNRSAYSERGEFLASSFREAEFWGRPLDEPQRVTIGKPLIGDEETIEKRLLGRRVASEGITMESRWALDAKLKRAAIAKGYDSIVLLSDKAFTGFIKSGKLPRSIELNIFNLGEVKRGPSVRSGRSRTM
ncbi:MAG TPA: hypothetical protein VHX36_09580 [Candidatus Acidoferrales bacterium]|nr:hypothetical protein [Candidatus Acidoferrales bacterium]